MAQTRSPIKLKRILWTVAFFGFCWFTYSVVTEIEGELSGGYFFYDEGPDESVIVHSPDFPGARFVPCTVAEHIWNQQFILAKQIAKRDCFWSIDGINHEQEADRTCFWIIEVEKEKIIGPLSNEAYFVQRYKSNIPDDLILDIDRAENLSSEAR